ncbi:tRNA lysidine(34) synthetase TilS [uncultured Ferrovibrio sp.]|jgi:tRNA(Ile)-lysidine synthase|uniref:tRNA lysidine(34) synthetase TilS n=1 Tax=uncultured Ferrovibrio sp. TaxID=1576913 RepID=UPI0026295609|nr:tRNA lysidine(34) synthetase TilS [uncultured Ferrovibrio sp.]
MVQPAKDRAVKPVTAAEFHRLLRPLLASDKAAKLAVAVSGGADSMALAVLARDWAAKHKAGLVALIVDHRLRAESTKEARHVARLLKSAGIESRVLTWKHTAKPTANRQAEARQARYDLLRNECRHQGIGHLLLAHHRDDQAETFLLRALRGSGVDGLSAMGPRRALDDNLVLLRPLLDIPKARLIATLRQHRQAWVEDPSNADPVYARVRVRQALDLLAGNDASARADLVTHLAQTARNLARARAALSDAAYDVLRAAAKVSPAGFAWLDPAPLQTASDEIALRGLARLLMAIGGQALPPRLDRLERLLQVLRDGLPKPQTLHGCQLRRMEEGILVCREARHLPAAVKLTAGAFLLWDGRFQVTAPRRVPPGLSLMPLGNAALPDEWNLSALPRFVRASLPALWRRERLLAVPPLHLGVTPPGITIVFRPAGTPGGSLGGIGEIL